MEKNGRVEILQCGNGFIVRSAIRDIGMIVSDDNAFVFQSYKALSIWLGEHFDHRDSNVDKD